jgi:hypothetical protein
VAGSALWRPRERVTSYDPAAHDPASLIAAAGRRAGRPVPLQQRDQVVFDWLVSVL